MHLLPAHVPDPLPNREIDAPAHRLRTLGAAALSDTEILSVMLRVPVDTARALLATTDHDLRALGRKTAADLVKVPGIGYRTAMAMLATIEFGKRRSDVDIRDRPSVATSAAAHELLRPVLQDLVHEEFWLLLLDRGNRLTYRHRVSMGGMHGTVADPKMIYKTALDHHASSIVLAHNHPSGQLRPSEEDIRLTRKLIDGGKLLDINVHDHLIVTDSGYYSFADNGML